MVQRIEEILPELHLSEQQTAQIHETLEKAREDFRTAMQEMQQLEPQERRARMREMTQDLNEQITAALTEDQKAIFQQKIEEMRTQGRRDGAQPAEPGAAGRVGAVIEQIRQAVEQLKLDDDQKAKVDAILRDTRAKLQVLRAEAAGDIEKLREKAREIVNETRQDLQEVLSEEQQQKLRELMDGVGMGRRADRPGRGNRPDRDAMPSPPADGADKTSPPATAPSDGPRSELPPPVNIRAGQAAADFALIKLDGRPVQLSSFKGRVLVLLFGNYSSPAFREAAADLEQLRKQYPARAEFLIVYTREAHPVGEWEVERNKDAKISVEQPKTLEERKALAQQAKQAMKLTTPIAIDTMDDQTARNFGVTTSAAAVVIGRDGRIVASRRSVDPHGLKRAIDEALLTRATTQPGRS
jgi:peroxiredoxin